MTHNISSATAIQCQRGENPVVIFGCSVHQARQRSLPPEVFEAIRRQLCVAHGVLNVPVTEIGLQRPRIVPPVSQSEAAGVSEHMGVSFEAQLSGRAPALYKPRKACRSEGRATL